MKDELIVGLVLMVGCIFMLMTGYEIGLDHEPKTQQNPLENYTVRCINNVKYIESKYDGFITALLDTNGKLLQCEVLKND